LPESYFSQPTLLAGDLTCYTAGGSPRFSGIPQHTQDCL
jgi:hypothetical protein